MKTNLGVSDSKAAGVPRGKEDCGCSAQGGAWEGQVEGGW